MMNCRSPVETHHPTSTRNFEHKSAPPFKLDTEFVVTLLFVDRIDPSFSFILLAAEPGVCELMVKCVKLALGVEGITDELAE